MTNSKKTKPAKPAPKRQQAVDTVKGSAKQDAQPWAKWNVKPVLKWMPALPDEANLEVLPESLIGQRIAYCRGQLDNLSVEALSRYTKYFDPEGVSRTSILRYEAGETLPGARELRILCDALWVPLDWLFYGRIGSAGIGPAERYALDAIKDLFFSYTGGENLIGASRKLAEDKEVEEMEKRKKWIHEARQPKPRE